MTIQTLGIISAVEFVVIVVLCYFLYSNNSSMNKRDQDILKSQVRVQIIEEDLKQEQRVNDSLQKLIPVTDSTITKEEKNLKQIIYVYKKDSARLTNLDADESIQLLSKYLSPENGIKW